MNKLPLNDEFKQRKTIILINSEQILMDITGRILERAGYAVRTAIGAAGAEELLADYTPDAIILSSELPDAEGLDYCRELKEKISVPIMYMSNDKEDELPALKAGASDFLKKPFDSEILKSRLGVMISSETDHVNAKNREENTKSGNEERENGDSGWLKNQIESLTGPKKENKKPQKKHVTLFLSSYAAIILIGVFLLNFVIGRGLTGDNIPEDAGNTGIIDVIDAGVPMADLPVPIIDRRAMPYSGTKHEDTIYIISDAAFPADTRDVAILLANPEKNTYCLTFEIILSDGSETIYKSDMVEPGMCIENITLARGLAEGGYDAIMRISTYAPESFTYINDIDVRFYINSG